MEIITSEDKLKEQFNLVVKMFLAEKTEESNMKIIHSFLFHEDNLFTNLDVFYNKKKINMASNEKVNLLTATKYHYVEMYAKILLYKIMVKFFHKKMPWGSLTGIRPSKLYYSKVQICGGNIKNASKIMKKVYLVSNKRIKLLEKIFLQQSIISEKLDDKNIDFYVNIPFCLSKCYYCSFLSATVEQAKNLIEPYVDALLKEINAGLLFLKKNKFHIKNIYIGGGTPTAIPLELLTKILKILPKVDELTVEAGRPDSISNDTFKVFKKYDVTRISINPQSFNNSTLQKIGRNHTAEDCEIKFYLAKKFNFQINMDLIAGLADEKLLDFKYSLNKAIKLQPDNITIHTLCYKRTSNLNLNGGITSSESEVQKMVEYSINKLFKNSYYPYYLYKQKNTIANMENIGYCKLNTICKFNIDSMEETSSVMACGANGISKRLYIKNNRIERYANVKNLTDYISRIDEIIDKKLSLFS